VSEGLVAAYRPFRCPDRYLFDPVTRLCQREEKVECKASLFYSLSSRLATTLREDQLDSFFSTPLTLPTTKTREATSSLQQTQRFHHNHQQHYFPTTNLHFPREHNLNPWFLNSNLWFPPGK